MLGELYRKFGLLVGGVAIFNAGGLLVIYGVLLFYAASPGTPTVREALGPLNDVLVTYVLNEITLGIAAVGLVGFAIEVYKNGLFAIDDRLLHEKMKDWRRQKAEENELWSPPKEDQEGPSMYEELREDVESSGLTILNAELDTSQQARVRGKLRNRSNATKRDVALRVTFLGRNGEEIATKVATRKRIEPRKMWEFEVFYPGEERVKDFRLARVERDRKATDG